MLNLSEITLCCVDTKYPQLALYALQHSMRGIAFGDVVFITSHECIVSHAVPQPVRVVEIDTIKSVTEYSQFVLASLVEHIHTPYVLLIQWDGYIINPQVWTDQFLSFDYIGAPWLLKDGSRLVGNGGFSLRSQKLLKALASDGIHLHHPEDDCISKTNRDFLEKQCGIRFADPGAGEKFSYEFILRETPTFGFHGFCNFPDVMSLEDLHHFVSIMPRHFVFSEYFPIFLEHLCKKIYTDALYGETMPLVQKVISEAFAHAKDEGHVPAKQFIKALIGCKMGGLAKMGLKFRITETGYSIVNLSLFFRWLVSCLISSFK